MRLLIPTLGTELTLDADWIFDLYPERRNNKFANQPGLDLNHTAYSPIEYRWVTVGGQRVREAYSILPAKVTLPEGTVLKVDRIYIRSKATDFRNFDSVTFYCNPGLKGKAAKGKLRGRFWAKLLDVNSAEVLIDPVTMPMPEYR